MRVGYSCQLLSEPSFGVSNHVLQLARALAAAADGDRLTFYVRARRDELASEASDQHLAPRATRWRAGRILWEQLALPRLAREGGLDVYHAPGYVMPLAMGVPAVATLYDVLAFTHPACCKPANRLHYRLAVPPTVRRARRIVASSRDVRERILERFPAARGKVVVVHPGVEDAFRTPPAPGALEAVRARYGLDAPFALFAGSREPKKNLGRLVDAFAAARGRGAVDGELVLAGGAGWGDVLRGREAVPGVRRLPYVPDRDLPLLYRAARLLAFPRWPRASGCPSSRPWRAGCPSSAPTCRPSGTRTPGRPSSSTRVRRTRSRRGSGASGRTASCATRSGGAGSRPRRPSPGTARRAARGRSTASSPRAERAPQRSGTIPSSSSRKRRAMTS